MVGSLMNRDSLLPLLLLCLTGCGADAVAPPIEASLDLDGDAAHVDASDAQSTEPARSPLPPPTLWELGDAPLMWSEWARSRPELLDVSSWAGGGPLIEGPLRHRALPDFGVGNGHVFSLVGYGQPINALHSMVGPYYHKGAGFFGDLSLQVEEAGADAVAWEHEWAGWVRGAPVVHTQAMNPSMLLSTTDFAPLVGELDDPVRRALIRVAVVTNHSDVPLSGYQLTIECARPQELINGGWCELREDRSRTVVSIGEPDAVIGQSAFVIPLGTLAPGEERVVVVASVTDDASARYDETLEALSLEAIDGYLSDTLEAWRLKTQRATRLITPDERVNDYLEGQRTIILSQQAYNGSSQPMSEYTGAWLRDQAGPIRYLLASGMAESAREMLDYLWLATLAQGEILNMSFGDYQPEDAGPEPDWSSMGVMDGRERAESPSYVPLMFYWYWLATADGSFLAERVDWLRACLDLQDIRDALLPFSTDETFRTAMAAAHSHSVLEQFELNFLSANSSFLWVAAAEGLAEMASGLLEDDGVALAADYLAQAEVMREAAEAMYAVPSGAYHPYVYEDTKAPAPAPFEDVNTKPLWSGYSAHDDPEAEAQLSALIEALGGDDGTLISPLPEDFEPVLDHPMSAGIYTGMSPGYFLSNLAVTHHPLAETAFNALALHATSSGATPEYHILDDYGPLHAVYDPVGGTGDYPARFRPWEGGILAEAAYAYLLGQACDARLGTLALAPSLPNSWSWLEAERLRCGALSLDLRIRASVEQWEVVVTHREGPAYELSLVLPFDATQVAGPIPLSVSTSLRPWGNTLTRLEPWTLEPGETQVFVFARR